MTDTVSTREEAIHRIEQLTGIFEEYSGPFGKYRDPEKPETVYNDIGPADEGTVNSD